MASFNIYHKDGSSLKDSNGKDITAHSLEYNGTWMGECFVSITFENEAPIDFSIGDYVTYREERFEINYDPGKIKAARKNSYGSAFRYENVKFNSLSDELVRCDMLDLVLYDNKLHYTALPQFVFYVESLDDLLDRIQANLDELYGKATWKLYSRNKERSIQRGCTTEGWESAYGEGTSDNVIDSTSISISDQNCWDALSLVNSQFDVNFIIRDRNVYVGTAGVPTSKIFKYGLGNGLYEIEQNSESDQAVITRLRAYGSNRNLPNHYYADLGAVPFLNITGDYNDGSTDNELSVMMEDSIYSGMFTDIISDNGASVKHCRIKGRIDGYEFDGEVEIAKKDAIKSSTRLLVTDKSMSDAVKSKIDNGFVQVDFLSGANKSKFDGNRINYVSNLPNNMACDRLMLPGFPNKTLKEWWDAQTAEKKAWLNPSGKEHIFSNEIYRPYVDSLNIKKIGVRPSSIFFDQDDKVNGIVEIYPTIEEMEVDGVCVDEIYTGTNIEDDGRFGDGETVANVDIYLSPKINFDIRGLMQDDFTIHMKDGMCAGREFKVAGCTKQNDGSWRLTIERKPDDSLNLYFPYKDFQIKKGDHFILTGIELPDEYIEAASEKLLRYSLAYLDKNDYTRYVYQPKVDDIFMARQHDTAISDPTGLTKSLYMTLKEGDIMLFNDEDLGIDAEITIDQLTIKEEDGKIPTYEIILREEKEVGTIQKIQNQISSITNGNGGVASGGNGGSLSTSQIKKLIDAVGSEKFLSKIIPDTANGLITFLRGLIAENKITARQGVDFGTFIAGLYGSGGNIDSMGRAELHSLFVRTSISAPKFVFNLVNVTKAEQWNTNGYGSIKSVDKDNRICELQLEDNEYGSLEVGDICRGIYADIDNAFGSDSNVEGAIDDCGFTVHQGFFTTYFYVEKVLESRKGVFKFRYGKRSETTPDPCAFMDFAQYGNFTNEERRASTYFSSRGKSYIEELGDVKTWEIQSENRVVRLGWLGNLQVKRKDGTWLQLKGNGLFVQNNIYFGGQTNFIDGLSELEDLKELAASYDVSLSQYQSVLTVDDMGNVINGLYTEDEAKTTKQYRISTAVFVRKGTQILLEEDAKNENVTEGHYRLHVVSEDCDVEVRNSTVFVKGIRNVKDGVSGTGDDTEFDYEAMRRTTDAMVMIVVNLEGKTSKTVQMPIRIQHDSLPFMVCDITNENASVAWNTKTKKYLGLPIKATVNLMYHNEPWKISECKIVSGVPEGLTATVALNENGKSYDITIDGNPADDTLPQVSNIVITVVGRYAGANYEYTKTLTLSKSADNVIYEIVPSADSIVVDKTDNMTANLLTCEIYATSSDDKRYKLTTLPDGFTLKYGKNTDTPDTVTSMDSAVVVNADDKQVTFALYDKSGNVLDKESVPVLAYGKDGKGIEYVFRRTTGSTPSISTPDDWATNADYQQEDYVPSGWTDDPVGVTEYYLYEWVATRKSVNGVWQPFGEVSEYAHFGKHAPRAIVSDDIVTIPTDSSGTTLTSFSETINFSMLVNASAATVNYISRTSSLPSGVSCTVYTRSIVISVAEGTSLGTVSKTLNFDVSGTLNSASYQDSVSIKIVPNVTGKDGDGYEYVYYLASQEIPSLAAPTRSGGTLTSGWQDDVPSMTDTARYIYVAWKTGEIGSDGNFSSPKLFSYKAKDGVGEATAYCRTAITPTISPSVTSRDTFVNADASAILGASLYGSDPAIGNTIITSGWDSIKSAATLHSYWRKNIPDAMEVTNVRANIDNFAKLSSMDSSGNMSYSDYETGYWNNTTLNGYGWWKSPDHEVGKDNSVTHVMKIEFTTTQANQVVTFVIRTSSEANYDYGILGKLDTELSFTTGGIGNYTVKVSGTNEVFVPILVSSAGNHHVWVAYSKDSSSKSGDDRCYVRIAADELHQIKGIVDGETIQWETISEVKATKGDKGYGCVMRISLWSKGKLYVNESNMEGDGTKYIDCVYVEDTTANEGYRLYECRVSHSSDEHTYEETNYWRQLSDQGPIYTPLIVAKNAVFKFAQGQQFNITDDSGVVWGSFRHVTNDNDLALWLGATSGTDGSNASFSVTKGGKMTAINAKISGEIEATSGKIGGMEITSNSIKSADGSMTLSTRGLSVSYNGAYMTSGILSFIDIASGSVSKTSAILEVGTSSSMLVPMITLTSTFAQIKVPLFIDLPRYASAKTGQLCRGDGDNDNHVYLKP